MIPQILLISALTVVNAYSGGNSYLGANIVNHHIPVIHNGVPVETPEVQAAKAQHYEAFAKASQRAAKHPETKYYTEKPIYEQQNDNNNYYKNPSPAFWTSNGLPQDTPEVAAAKATHLAALQKANSLEFNNFDNDDGEYHGEAYYQSRKPSRYSATPTNNVAYHGNSASYTNQYSHVGPVDTPEVQQAKAAHLAALSHATAAQNRYKRSLYQYLQPQHIPIITKEGVPLETPEVQHAKAEHLLAHAKAKAGSHGYYGDYLGHDSVSYGIGHYEQKYHGPQHIPILDKNGVPIDTPEVQAARHEHFLAHAKASYGGYGHPVVPLDTPEVQLAKAEHFAAHAKERARHNHAHVESEYDNYDDHSGSYGTIAGYLGDSNHEITVLDHGHNQITKTSTHVNHDYHHNYHY